MPTKEKKQFAQANPELLREAYALGELLKLKKYEVVEAALKEWIERHQEEALSKMRAGRRTKL